MNDQHQQNEETDYIKYRGKCKELSELAIKNDPTLTLVRGHYYCPVWRSREPHWWTTKLDGTIFDPTKDQFPSKGLGEYEEFSGLLNCTECGKEITEDQIYSAQGRHVVCSYSCYASLIGF